MIDKIIVELYLHYGEWKEYFLVRKIEKILWSYVDKSSEQLPNRQVKNFYRLNETGLQRARALMAQYGRIDQSFVAMTRTEFYGLQIKPDWTQEDMASFIRDELGADVETPDNIRIWVGGLADKFFDKKVEIDWVKNRSEEYAVEKFGEVGGKIWWYLDKMTNDIERTPFICEFTIT